MLCAAALAGCKPDNNDVTGSIDTCVSKLYTPYNPKNMKQYESRYAFACEAA